MLELGESIYKLYEWSTWGHGTLGNKESMHEEQGEHKEQEWIMRSKGSIRNKGIVRNKGGS